MTFETSQTTLYRVKSCHACSNFSPDSFELSNETGLNITIVFNFKKMLDINLLMISVYGSCFLEPSNDHYNNLVPQGFTVQQSMHFYCLQCKSAKRDEFNPFSTTSIFQKSCGLKRSPAAMKGIKMMSQHNCQQFG